MGFFARFFSRSADDYLAKGDALLDAQRSFEARTMYQDGLQSLSGKGGTKSGGATADQFIARIADANRALAEMNIGEARASIRIEAFAKAVEHLELAKSLSDDRAIQEAAGQLLASLANNSSSEDPQAVGPSAGSCGSCSVGVPEMSTAVAGEEPDMSDQDYYDLLIRQLPEDIQARYSHLGGMFASMYLAASRDDHERALDLLDEWYKGTDTDIYSYEKGMILYRLGRVAESEICLRDAMLQNDANPLPHLSLALLLIDGQRLEEAALLLDAMISKNLMTGQAIMVRGDVALLADDLNGALNRYATLLTTPLVRQAAEKLSQTLHQAGRDQEAAAVFKKYLGGCRH